MKIWQYILVPFGFIYGSILWFRRAFYLTGIFKRTAGKIPSLIIGNLQVGGAGKTPMAIWLAGKLSESKNIALLSRGYGRKTTGYFEVLLNGTATKYGDEPLEMRTALPSNIRNYVCENRVDGIFEIFNHAPETSLVILDDAYQHLSLKGDFYLLLTEYAKLFIHDYPMPAGRLREFSSAAKDANVIIVTKCPEDLDVESGLEIYKKLLHFGKPIFFASYVNSLPRNAMNEALPIQAKILLVAGLANNEAMRKEVAKNFIITETFFYKDHHHYQQADVNNWNLTAQKLGASAIVTSRKDWMRLKDLSNLEIPVYSTYTEPVFLFDGEETLLEIINREML